jgi:hypothetical protein
LAAGRHFAAVCEMLDVGAVRGATGSAILCWLPADPSRSAGFEP